MIYKRRYLQFNNLVLEGMDVISDDTSISFKTFETNYGFGHGSYAPFKRKGMWLESGRVSMSLTFKLKKYPCSDKQYFVRFAKNQLAEQGKLWAIQEDTLIWAYAYATNIVEVNDRNNAFTVDIDFAIPEGVWHKADKMKTFVVPYDPFDFADDYHEIDYTDCLKCKSTVRKCNCCDDSLSEEMSLVYFDDLTELYGCEAKYRFVYDCIAGEKYFDYCSNVHPGQKMCSDCGGTISGQFYSDTDIPTDGVKITIHGKVKDPYIEINGNGNTILGEYDGTLTVNSDGSVYYETDCCETLMDVGVWVVPENMEYGWLVHQGNNRVIVDTNECCGTCVYIEADSLAI